MQEFDVTGLVHPGENVIVVRVHQWSSTSYLEDQDQWWLPGIFRDVTLLSRPVGAIDDVWLRTAYAADGSGSVSPAITGGADAFPVTVDIPELGVSETIASVHDQPALSINRVDPWSAESPRRYEATVSSRGETVRLRVGFRTVEIDGDVLLVKQRQVIFRGMNRHETHPVRGRMFDADHARAGLIMMKQHGVNAIRTKPLPAPPPGAGPGR